MSEKPETNPESEGKKEDSVKPARPPRKPTTSKKETTENTADQEVYVVARGRTVHTESGALKPGAEYDGPVEDVERLVGAGFILKRSDLVIQADAAPGISPA